jgi:hypothetical protein
MKGQVEELQSTDPVIAHCPACGAKCCLHYQGTRKRKVVAIFVSCANDLCLYRLGTVLDNAEDAENIRRHVVMTHKRLVINQEAMD